MNTILIYEDNDNLRESICALLYLAQGYDVTGAFGNCLEAGEQVKTLNPDIILMDIDMPGMNGIEAVKKIRTFNNHVQIVMLTVFEDSEHVFSALYNGANGYLLKNQIADRLIISIKDILLGGAPMSPVIARMVISSMRRHTPENDYKLTRREKDILLSLSRGNSVKMIAAEYDLSLDTVRTHTKHIYDKLHVNSQTEAVSKALNEKLV